MLNARYFVLARLLTGVRVSDEQIQKEYEEIQQNDKNAMIEKIDKLLYLNNVSFEKGFGLIKDYFARIATEYNLSPATLFCIYKESKDQ